MYLRKQNILSYKNLYMDVHRIIHKNQNVETTQMFINWWMVKQTTVYPYNEIPGAV